MKTSQFFSKLLLLWMFSEISEAQIFLQGQNLFSTEASQDEAQNVILETSGKEHDVVKRWVDRYRFFGAGLGKRALSEPHTANRDAFNVNIANSQKTTRTKMLLPKTLQNKYKQIVRDMLSNMILHIGDDQLENKRVPEVFKEEYYPIQAGKQQLEFKLDKTLDNDTVDKPTESYSGDIIVQAADLAGLFSNDNQQGQSTSDEQENDRPKMQKKWWAINQLRAFRHPKSASSAQWHRRGRVRIDPGLYFVGLGK